MVASMLRVQCPHAWSARLYTASATARSPSAQAESVWLSLWSPTKTDPAFFRKNSS
jgi:hypothetical protein